MLQKSRKAVLLAIEKNRRLKQRERDDDRAKNGHASWRTSETRTRFVLAAYSISTDLLHPHECDACSDALVPVRACAAKGMLLSEAPNNTKLPMDRGECLLYFWWGQERGSMAELL